MADNLIQKSHKTSEKNKYNNVIHRTTSESLRLNESEKGVTHPTSLQAAHNPRKISSFQITSVTLGSRVSTDAGEDSADDLDESHTDDISRVTDIENETPSFSEDTFSKDDVFYNASSTSLGCAPVIPTSSQYGLAIVGQDNANNQIGSSVPNSNNTEANDMHVSVTNASAGSIINLIGNAKPQEGMKEIQEHVRNERFKVVKIESTEPFRRGRWICMDYLDHSTSQQNAPITLNNNQDVTETNTLQAPDSGVVINDSQHDEVPNDLSNKCPNMSDLQGNAPTVQQLEQALQKQFPMASPGQSLTQPINVVQQQMPVSQPITVQSPPLEMPQQISNQNMQGSQQVGQQHPQSMTHITMQNAAQGHPQQNQQQQVQQITQNFPPHQLQQVIAQTQGITMQQIPMHQQMPQQMQQMPNQQMQQMGQHIPQAQIPNMQMQQQMPQMQAMTNQGQMPQVPTQQPQMQQMQMQQMQGQPNPQLHMQQTQITNMGQSHHLQSQQSMGTQQAQLQHLPSQAQIQALQSQQIPNHIQQMQMPTQLTNTNQQIPQMQTQMHQLSSQQQQTVVPGMHPQMSQQGMPTVQQQYNQAVNQQSTAQSMINPNMPSSQPQMVQHSVPQYHTQQSQMSQQGQTLPQEVLSTIVTSQQGATLPTNLQPMASQPQGTTLPANLQSLAGQQPTTNVHPMAPQQGNVPQGNLQMMSAPPQNMQMTLDGNQPSMQIPATDPIFMQTTNVGQQLPVGQHMAQQNMLPQQVGGQGQMGAVQYVPNQSVTMAHQNMSMSMQPTMPVGMGSGVHPNVVPSQTSMGLGYGGVVPVMSQSNVAPVEATVSGTNSPVVSLPVNSTAYVTNTQPGHDSQGFGSPVSAVVSHAISGAVVSNVNVNACESGAPDVSAEAMQPGDIGDGKEETQNAPPTEDESASGTSAVAIDNKIEQAMDLVKSHLMFAVREEVEVLKERIAELMERITQLEVENTYLRAHASQDTLAQLPAAQGNKPAAQPQPPVS
ncbi:protein bunched, class 2/F/G isoform isoform X3 [Bombyx mori]|uniref:Uncharacterized protein n=1 Tax=Bombyx mori TaxID=7091 RepID=A0A8R1WKY7_BOMMO|nr:protein bunched, class 2/F/G isoform isoform X3 [Bombyx mori]